MDLDGANVLITGGTGTFGREALKLLPQFRPRRLIVLSRDEYKQHYLQKEFPENDSSIYRYILADVRDKDKLSVVTRNVDVIFHAAALKQVPFCETNPDEAIQTNVLGTKNVCEASMKNDVDSLIFVSSDKAVEPVNLYGATKMVGERLVNQYNFKSDHTKFFTVRYGNVFNSRGSVVELFHQQKSEGVLTLTHPDMTRFFFLIQDAILFAAGVGGAGGEIFVPAMKSMRICDLAKAIAPEAEIKIILRRHGEKVHEKLISSDEADRTVFKNNKYIILPNDRRFSFSRYNNSPKQEGLIYTSDRCCMDLDGVKEFLRNHDRNI